MRSQDSSWRMFNQVAQSDQSLAQSWPARSEHGAAIVLHDDAGLMPSAPYDFEGDQREHHDASIMVAQRVEKTAS